MACWLLKTEPSEYSWDALVREGRTTWDGVRNATAQMHLRSMSRGDLALIYHTGDEKRIVGIAEVAAPPRPDPAGDGKAVCVDLKPKRALKRPVTLARIRAEPALAGWDLLRIGRLSVVRTPEAMFQRIEQMAKEVGDG